MSSKKTSRGVGYYASKAGMYAVVILLTVIVLAPFYLIIVSSFKTSSEILSPTFSWWPEVFSFDGYKNVFTTDGILNVLLDTNILKAFWNTMWQSLLPTLVGVFVSGMCGFALAKIKFPGRKAFFTIMMATMMIPGTITLVSSYMIYDYIGWTNSPLPLIIPGLFGGASNVFFMRQYFLGVPDELIDAAKIDGLGNFQTYIRIIIPVSVPVFVSLSLLSFIGHYNAYLNPMLYLGDESRYFTLQILLRAMMSMFKNDWNLILSSCVLSILPLLILYLFTQKFFLNGISISSGLKG